MKSQSHFNLIVSLHYHYCSPDTRPVHPPTLVSAILIRPYPHTSLPQSNSIASAALDPLAIVLPDMLPLTCAGAAQSANGTAGLFA